MKLKATILAFTAFLLTVSDSPAHAQAYANHQDFCTNCNAEADDSLSIFVNGIIVKQQEDVRNTIAVPNHAGMYLIEIPLPDGTTVSEKIIVN